MDWKLELVAVPVSDVDRAKAFYTEKIGFHADHDQQVNEKLRFVQLTPPGSACVNIGTGLAKMKPGSLEGLQDVGRALRHATWSCVEALPISDQLVGELQRPRRQQMGRAGVAQAGLDAGQLAWIAW